MRWRSLWRHHPDSYFTVLLQILLDKHISTDFIIFCWYLHLPFTSFSQPSLFVSPQQLEHHSAEDFIFYSELILVYTSLIIGWSSSEKGCFCFSYGEIIVSVQHKDIHWTIMDISHLSQCLSLSLINIDIKELDHSTNA